MRIPLNDCSCDKDFVDILKQKVISYTHASAVTKSTDMLNKNTLGAKNCEANQKQQLNGYTCDQNV